MNIRKMKCNFFIILCISAFLLYVVVSQSYKEGLELGPNPIEKVVNLMQTSDKIQTELTPEQILFIKSPDTISCIQKQLQILFSAIDTPAPFHGVINIIPAVPLFLGENIDGFQIVQPSDGSALPNAPINVENCNYDMPLPNIPPNIKWTNLQQHQIDFIKNIIPGLKHDISALLTSAENNKNLDPNFTVYVKYLCNNIQQLWDANSATILVPTM